jgi:DMSO/TMAO reductase YedYZ molybdopterin-dependent catalytic subunit
MFTRSVGILFFALRCHSALSQTSSESQAAVTGTVSDPSRNVLQHAEVSVASVTSSSDIHKAQTDEQGQFSLPVVVGLQYVLTVHEDGFRPYSLTFVGGQKLPAIQLLIAGNKEQVTVNASGAAIDLQQTQTGTTLEEQQGAMSR